jgi:mRNA interferase RelE/StbE
MDAGQDQHAYQVLVTTAAQRDLKRLQKQLTRPLLASIDAAIRGLGAEPRPQGCQALAGAAGVFRGRVSDYRILYAVDDAARVIRIARVRHRRDAYRP